MNEKAGKQDLRLGELLILALLWMVFGFMLWYYLSAFHGVPVRLLADGILSRVLGPEFVDIVPNPDRQFLFQVRTNIPFQFPDGSREALGFIVNPLIFSFGLPLLFGLVMASNAPLLRKLLVLVLGWVCVMLVQVWGVVWQTLKMLAFNFGPDAHQAVVDAGISEDLIALCYQLGVLILPSLAPVILWVLANWKLVEQFTGYHKQWKSKKPGTGDA